MTSQGQPGPNHAKRGLLALSLLLGAAPCVPVHARQDPSEHAKHHPGQAPGPQPPAPPDAGGMEGMMQGMMGGPPPRELYPSLMELPALTPEQRDVVQRAAHERMEAGTALMADALDALLRAAPTNDYAGMQDAIVRLREGLARFDSGLSAHRAIAEGRGPQDVALEWFKTQMNLVPPRASARRAGPFGLSWSHAIAMFLLTLFAVVMIAMYVFKMRRAAALLQRLTQPAPGAVAAPAAMAAAPAPLTPPAIGAVERPAPAREASAGGETAAVPWAGSLRVACIFRETPSIQTFRLVNPAGGPIPFGFLPGQFLTLAVALAGQTTKRSYTIASSPAQRDYVEITVKREELGVVSRYLHDRLRPGDLLQVSAPQGRFTFTGTEADGIVLIGGGVGITPLMSVIRTLTDRGWDKGIDLLYACRTMEDFVFRDELERLQRRHPNLHVVATMTRAEGTVWMGARGRLTKELIAESVRDLPRRRVHLCGPPPMMDAVRVMLRDLGVPAEQIWTEAFGPAEKRETRQAAVQTAMVEAPPATTPTVTFTISGKAAPLPRDATVLEAAEHVGVSIDNSCRAGTCGTCKVKLLKGTVTMAVEDALSPEEKSRGIILACQAKSTQNLEVEA